MNSALREVQKQEIKISLGQILIRKHLISPHEFVQINKTTVYSQESKILNRFAKNQINGVIEFCPQDTPFSIAHYEIIREIARGGMGVVYEAKDTRSEKIVALKTLISGEMADSLEIERFLREARLTLDFDHPGIVPIHEVGSHENLHYFTMDYIEGLSLSDYVRETRAPLRKIVKMMSQIVNALSYAHSKGVIHRDIKPANIMVDTSGNPLIMDFGLGRRKDESQKLTMSGVALGTPSYMPPEQAQGRLKEIDAKSDIYSIGAVFYELLAGRPPFSGASLAETLQAVIHDEPIALSQLVPGIPQNIETICMKCLAKNKQRRYHNAKSLLRDLDRFLRGDTIRARRLSFHEIALKWIRRNKLSAIYMAVISFLMVLLFTIVATKNASILDVVKKYKKESKQRDKLAEEKKNLTALNRKNARELTDLYRKLKESRRSSKNLQETVNRLQKQMAESQKTLERTQKMAFLLASRAKKIKGKLTRIHLYDATIEEKKFTIRIRDKRVKEYLDEATEVLVKKDYQRAIDIYSKILKIDPEMFLCYWNRAALYFLFDKWDKCLEDCRKILELRAHYPDGYFLMALAYHHLGKTSRAIKTLKKAIFYQPKEAHYSYILALFYKKENEFQKAKVCLTKALELCPVFFKARFSRGLANYKLREYSSALADFEHCYKYSSKYRTEKVQSWIMKVKQKLK